MNKRMYRCLSSLRTGVRVKGNMFAVSFFCIFQYARNAKKCLEKKNQHSQYAHHSEYVPNIFVMARPRTQDTQVRVPFGAESQFFLSFSFLSFFYFYKDSILSFFFVIQGEIRKISGTILTLVHNQLQLRAKTMNFYEYCKKHKKITCPFFMVTKMVNRAHGQTSSCSLAL